MAKYNRKCFYCGQPYYCCSSCVSINSWKNTHCSTECFIKSQEENLPNIKPVVIDKGEVFMKAAIKRNGKTINITGYDLELGKFDCSDDKTRVLDDFEYFIVTAEEMGGLTVKRKSSKKEITGRSEKFTVDIPRK